VADRIEVERTVKQMLGSQRVRGRRELFRTDVATARQAIEAAACRKAPSPLVTRRRRRGRYGRLDFRRRPYRRRWSTYAIAMVGLGLLYVVL
jgi:hypothetical protein